jgi:hypothetical protein
VLTAVGNDAPTATLLVFRNPRATARWLERIELGSRDDQRGKSGGFRHLLTVCPHSRNVQTHSVSHEAEDRERDLPDR